MPKDFARLVALLLACGLAAGCAREEGEATPVATPSVMVSRASAAVGSPIDITYRFDVASDAPSFADNHLVFVHFIDRDGERMWTDDHLPATPTTAWKPGQRVEYTRTIFVPKVPYTGSVSVELGLYSPGTGERLPLGGEDSGMRAYRVATFDMTQQAENVFVVFTNGWYETEVTDDGLEWQWSEREGTIAFRNPRRDAELFLQLDQAVDALPQPQQVEVRLGGQVLEVFPVPVGERTLRRIPLTAGQLGSADTVEMTIAVDRTFVPADVPGLRSADARELGVRVFRAYVEPK